MNFEETAGPTTLSNEPMPMSTFKKSILDFKNNDGMKDEIGGPESKDARNIEPPDVQLGGPGWGGRRKSRRSKKSTRRNKTKRKKSRKSRK